MFCFFLHMLGFSCRRADRAVPSGCHRPWRRLIGYYLCCQKPGRAPTSPHQSRCQFLGCPWTQCCRARASVMVTWRHALPQPKTPSAPLPSPRFSKLGFLCITGTSAVFKTHSEVIPTADRVTAAYSRLTNCCA